MNNVKQAIKKIIIPLLAVLGILSISYVYGSHNVRAASPSSWKDLFGLGYNPNHFYNGKVQPTTTDYDSFNTHDNLIVPIDLPAIQKAGFNSVRIYGGSPLTVIRTIQTSGKLGMGVVWTIGMPPSSDPTKPSVYPPNSSTPNYRDFLQVLDYAKSNPSFGLQFQNTVKVIAVWNEKIFNTGMNGNLCAWIRAVGDTLHNQYGFSNIPVTTAAPTGVWLGEPGSPTANRSNVLQAIIDANQNTVEIPVLCHMYPFQWGNIYYDSSGKPDIDSSVPKNKYGIPAMRLHTNAGGGSQWSIYQSVNDVNLENSVAWDINLLKVNFGKYERSLGTSKNFKIVIGETGWSTSGYDQAYGSYGYVLENPNNLSKIEGNSQQAAEYAQALYNYCSKYKIPVMYFMAMDVPWKPGSESIVSDNAEANYGIFDTWGIMKKDPSGKNNFYPSSGSLNNVSINFKDYTVMPYNPGDSVIPYTTVVKYTQGGKNLEKTFSDNIDTRPGNTFFGLTGLFIKSGDTVQIFNQNDQTLSSLHTLVKAESSSPLDPPHMGGVWNSTVVNPENNINWADGDSSNTSGINLPAMEPIPFIPGPKNSQMFHAVLYHDQNIDNSSINLESTVIPGYSGNPITGIFDNKDSNDQVAVFTSLYFADNGKTTYNVKEGSNSYVLTINATNGSITSSDINGINVSSSKTGTGFWNLNIPQP